MDELIKTWEKKHSLALLLLIAYMFQGIASLIYQVNWEQATEAIVGTALPTMAIVVSLFFLGMGLGAFIFGKILLNDKHSGILFIINSIILSVWGMIFVATDELKFLCSLTTQDENCLLVIYLFRLFLFCLYLLIPAVLIGASFPLLLRSWVIRQLTDGPLVLYLVNIVGSIIGAILAGFVLLPHWGIAISSTFAASLHLLCGLIVLAIYGQVFFDFSTSLPRAIYPELKTLEERAQRKSQLTKSLRNKTNRKITLLVIVSAGFLNMLLELLFIRLYALFIGSSGFAFSLVIAMQLLALGSGAFIVRYVYKPRKEYYWSLFAVLHIVAACWLLSELFVLPSLASIIQNQSSFLQLMFQARPDLATIASTAITLFFTMFVPSFCLGAILPLYFQLRQQDSYLAPLRPSSVYALNLLAALFGTLAGGLYLIPCLSIISSHAICLALTLSALMTLFIGLVILYRSNSNNSNRKNKIVYGALSACTLTLIPLLSPIWQRPLLTRTTQLLFYKEGMNSTVSLTKNAKENVIWLQTDGQAEGSVQEDPSLPAPTSDEQTQALLGLLPGIFYSAPPKNVFLLGLGNGVTARAILDSPEVQHLTVAEMEPAVVDAARFLRKISNNVYGQKESENNELFSPAQKRLNIKIVDGRNLLSQLDSRYDVIISQASEPWRSQSRYLYTLEFWQLVKSRLQTDGIFCQWLPLNAMDENNLIILGKTFTNVFPNTFVIKSKRAGEIILLAINSSDNQNQTLSGLNSQRALVRTNLNDMKRALVRIGFDGLSAIIDNIVMTPLEFNDWLHSNTSTSGQGEVLNRDVFPLVQYDLSALVRKYGNNIGINLDQILAKILPSTRLNDSEREIEKVKLVDDDSINAQLVVGQYYLSCGAAHEAASCFSLITKQDRLNMPALLGEAKAQILLNDLSTASDCLQRLLEYQPNNFEARFLLGKILCNLGLEEEGLLQIKWASKIEPQNPDPNLYVTAFYISKTNWTLARQNLELLKNRLANNPDVIYLGNKISKQERINSQDDRLNKLLAIYYCPI